MNEEVAASLWLKDFLSADAQLAGSVSTFALRSTKTTDPLPYIKIDILDRSDKMTIAANRVWANLTFLVRGITKGPDWEEVQDIGDRIDAVLHRAAQETADILIREVYREETFSEETVESGDLYLHSGGIYRVLASAP